MLEVLDIPREMLPEVRRLPKCTVRLTLAAKAARVFQSRDRR